MASHAEPRTSCFWPNAVDHDLLTVQLSLAQIVGACERRCRLKVVQQVAHAGPLAVNGAKGSIRSHGWVLELSKQKEGQRCNSGQSQGQSVRTIRLRPQDMVVDSQRQRLGTTADIAPSISETPTSPMARPDASTSPVRMPSRACGNPIFMITCQGLHPALLPLRAVIHQSLQKRLEKV